MNLLPVSPDAAAAFFAVFSLFFGWIFGGWGIPVAFPTDSEASTIQLTQVIWGKGETKDEIPSSGDPTVPPAPPSEAPTVPPTPPLP